MDSSILGQRYPFLKIRLILPFKQKKRLAIHGLMTDRSV